MQPFADFLSTPLKSLCILVAKKSSPQTILGCHLETAVEKLSHPDAKVLAGGQSLVPMLALRLTRFEHKYRHAHHDHMICTECGTILEFLSPEIERLQDEIAEAYGFAIDSHRHQIFGRCQKCRRPAARKGSKKR